MRAVPFQGLLYRAGILEPRRLVSDMIALDDTPGVFESLKQRTEQCRVLIAP